MRRPEYISPSALSTYKKDPQEYYMSYLADNRPPRFPQTEAMSVGSAFDANVKSYLHNSIYGRADAKFELEALFESQVEKQNRDMARPIGIYLFEQYKKSGALADLMLELKNAVDDPHFEFEIRGVVHGVREGVEAKRMGVPLLGKPDIKFINSSAATVIFDWKVNGWFSKGNTSPVAGYVECREQSGDFWKRNGCHKDAYVMPYKGVNINVGGYLEDNSAEWAAQLATYSWLLGASVGAEEVIGIDQFACHGGKRDPKTNYPNIRIASHRSRISRKFQFNLIAEYIGLWGLITDEPFYFFREMSFEDSAAKCKMLDDRAALYDDPTLTDTERWTLEQGRKPR